MGAEDSHRDGYQRVGGCQASESGYRIENATSHRKFIGNSFRAHVFRTFYLFYYFSMRESHMY